VLDRLPIRWRLALTSAALTFAILLTFAAVVGELTQRRIRDDFKREVAEAADKVERSIGVVPFNEGRFEIDQRTLDLVAGAENGVLRIVSQDGQLLARTPGAPSFGGPPFPEVPRVLSGYRVETRTVETTAGGFALMQFGRPVSDLEATLRRVRTFLILGVLGGTALALLGGVLIARRAMAPIAELTETAEQVRRRQRDPGEGVRIPELDDEVGQLARTLDGMLRALDDQQTEMEGLLGRQREFVADASHELRTPLTSVLANLELLADSLDGEEGEAARSALRSSQRMRRLVADLLLLARADAERAAPRRPVDLGEVLVEAAAEVGALGDGHELTLEADPGVVVDGVRDDLHRVALNLLENAIRHTPPGTHVRARAERDGGAALLVVSDDGPGIPAGLRDKVFERFVRGGRDQGRSFGLGLAIVRAVAEHHGGTVTVDDAGPGARFTVRLPAIEAPALTPPPRRAAPSGAA
jgi:two-component system, OmpR family, sensor kinase